MPDPSDGSLYYFQRDPLFPETEVLKKLGPTIPQMIESSPTKSSDGLLYTGDKRDKWQIIDADNGEVIQTIDQNVCFSSKIFSFFFPNIFLLRIRNVKFRSFRDFRNLKSPT